MEEEEEEEEEEEVLGEMGGRRILGLMGLVGFEETHD